MSNNFELECGYTGILNKYMCIDLINDTKKGLKPWKYNFIINSTIIVLFFAVCIWRMINHTATEKNVCYLAIMCIGAMISCVALTNFFKNYKQNKKLYKLIRLLRWYGGGHLYDVDFHDSFVLTMIPICNYIEKILHKKVSPYKYKYQIIAITKNNGETRYYATVKMCISNIREYIGSDYKTYAEAKQAVETFKANVISKQKKLEDERKKKEENERKQREKQKQAELKQKQERKKEKHDKQVKRKVIIDCN